MLCSRRFGTARVLRAVWNNKSAVAMASLTVLLFYLRELGLYLAYLHGLECVLDIPI